MPSAKDPGLGFKADQDLSGDERTNPRGTEPSINSSFVVGNIDLSSGQRAHSNRR